MEPNLKEELLKVWRKLSNEQRQILIDKSTEILRKRNKRFWTYLITGNLVLSTLFALSLPLRVEYLGLSVVAGFVVTVALVSVRYTLKGVFGLIDA